MVEKKNEHIESLTGWAAKKPEGCLFLGPGNSYNNRPKQQLIREAKSKKGDRGGGMGSVDFLGFSRGSGQAGILAE
jgi:hypothetical protein